MAYIGNQNYQAYVTLNNQTFTTSGSTTIYALNYTVTNANNLDLYIGGSKQQPGVAYTASGNTLTLTTATSSSMYAVYLGQGIQTTNLPTGVVSVSNLNASGTPSSTTFLRGDNTWNSPLAGSGPAFSAYANANQTISNSTYTKLQINTKVFDTNNNYDATTNYRFTPTVAGYYQVNYGTNPSSAANNTLAFIILYKNGSFSNYGSTATNNTVAGIISIGSSLINMNGSTDYLELYAYQNSGGSLTFNGTTPGVTYFQASFVRTT